ncbi:MAG: PQQ-dependent sugar dehydrogenase [Candidatus Doudnabacteria bacterium]|nr:PQQ-dependent sugar dehydrogenase [Candidatus Doudnabacteria bacterium]
MKITARLLSSERAKKNIFLFPSERRQYRLLPIFFLSLLAFILVLPANAAEVTLQAPSEYKVTKIVDAGKAVAFTFDFEGNYITAENIGMPAIKKRPEIIAYKINKISSDGSVQSLLDRTGQKVDNLSYYRGEVYIVTRGNIFKIVKGKIFGVITSLPTYGDYANSNLVFNNGYMYFAVGTATNSGIIGPDNSWLKTYPSFRDTPCATVKVNGVNVETDNYLTEKKDDKAQTSGFGAFNTPLQPGQMVYGRVKCNSGVIKSSTDGVMSEVFAWGFHNPKGLSIDDKGQLWIFDGGMEDRGVRPIKDGKDALFSVSQNNWYGWPDFNAGTPVDTQPVLAEFPNHPPKPNRVFDMNKIVSMMVSPSAFAVDSAIAQIADDKLALLDLKGNNLDNFLTVSNAKILQYKFGPNDKLYLLIATPDGKTSIYSVESTVPRVAAGIISVKNRSTWNNWLVGIMLAVFAGAGFFVLRNMRRPIPPF